MQTTGKKFDGSSGRRLAGSCGCAGGGCVGHHSEHPYKVSHFWTCAELLPQLPQVSKLRDTYQLFVRTNGNQSIDILNVSECLRAMGVSFKESHLKACLVQRLLRFPQVKPPTRVSFELVLSIYCELSQANEIPSAKVMINGLSCCDMRGTGMLPYAQLQRILTTVAERLNETDACALLDTMKDASGNVNYVALMEALFVEDSELADRLLQARLYLSALGDNACHMDMQKRDDFIRALRRLDGRNTGYVTAERLLELLNQTGDRFSVAELAALTRTMVNSKKQIDYRRFLRLIMNE
ncbi:uncharacterized protein LOC111596806 [Drosophila hydei]|uniref:Uncharacterized protein LOC111596806 n=1 Tax=Drosophila hydei TaxID=7224 RepID=A0A6J1LT17_DROHY|nr:uncharacterized protein LOC111596806 [Drosophila hydei]